MENVKSVYKSWLPIQRNLPKGERFGLGAKIDQLFITLLEKLHRASFSSPEAKLPMLSEALLTVDSIRFFIQLSWELKLIPTKQFSEIGQDIESVGKMVGGWRKGLLTKTSPTLNQGRKDVNRGR